MYKRVLWHTQGSITPPIGDRAQALQKMRKGDQIRDSAEFKTLPLDHAKKALHRAEAKANQVVGIHVIVQGTPRVQFTLQDIQHETDFRLLDLDKLFIGPVSL